MNTADSHHLGVYFCLIQIIAHKKIYFKIYLLGVKSNIKLITFGLLYNYQPNLTVYVTSKYNEMLLQL